MNFWEKLPKPFFALAPMESVTDVVFRHVILQAGRPDIFFTEFTNAASFCSEKGEFSTRGRLDFADNEQPIVAQIWGRDPENFRQMAHALTEKGFAGIDINMGCPDKSVVKNGSGSALIENPDLAAKLIKAAKEGWETAVGTIFSKDPSPSKTSYTGAPAEPSSVKTNLSGTSGIYVFDCEGAKSLEKFIPTPAPPISVKTRLGVRSVDEWRPWLTTLLEQNLANLTVHLRTRKEMSRVPAHFELIPEIVKLRDEIAPQTKLTINGDIRNHAHGLKIWHENPGVDGFMIGRGVFANPFCFTNNQNPTREQLLELLGFHLDQFDKFRQIAPNLQRKFDPLKHFFKIYIKDFAGAAELRARLYSCKTTDEVRQIISETATFER